MTFNFTVEGKYYKIWSLAEIKCHIKNCFQFTKPGNILKTFHLLSRLDQAISSYYWVTCISWCLKEINLNKCTLLSLLITTRTWQWDPYFKWHITEPLSSGNCSCGKEYSVWECTANLVTFGELMCQRTALSVCFHPAVKWYFSFSHIDNHKQGKICVLPTHEPLSQIYYLAIPFCGLDCLEFMGWKVC